MINFFKKKIKDARFSKLGPGRSLTEAPKDNNCSQSYFEDTRTQRSVPSESVSKAAEAALNRSAAKQVKPKSAARSFVEAEMASNKRELEEAEALASKFADNTLILDGSQALKRVLFSCPNLLGDGFVGSYSEVDAAIDKFLSDEVTRNPHEAASLMLMRGIEASRLPLGIDVNDDSTPSLKEIREKRRQNFEKIIRNLIEFPDNEAYRRLRVSNKLISDLLTVKGAAEFFKECGFIRTNASGNQIAEESEDEFLVLPLSTDTQQDHLKKMLHLIELAEPPMPELNRDTTVLKATEASVRTLTRDDLPAEYFYISREDLKRMVEAQRQVVEESGMLLTKALRERLKTQERRIYRFVLIRVRLPEDLIIQGTFKASETVNDVCVWISDCLADPSIAYKLWAPPGQPMHGRPMTTRICLTDSFTSSLVDLGLAPCSLLTITTDTPQLPLTVRPDLISTTQSL